MHPLFEQPQFTHGELGFAIFAIHDHEAAADFARSYVAWARAHEDEQYRTDEGSHALVMQNIGWFFGEGMPQADVDMWVAATGAYHPIFGTMEHAPTPEEAFSADDDLAQRKEQEDAGR